MCHHVLQAQQMIADNSGLALAVSLTFACRHDPRARRLLPLLAFPLLAAGDLCSIYRELKAIHLHNLNKQRSEILADVWLGTGRIPSPAEVLFCCCSANTFLLYVMDPCSLVTLLTWLQCL